MWSKVLKIALVTLAAAAVIVIPLYLIFFLETGASIISEKGALKVQDVSHEYEVTSASPEASFADTVSEPESYSKGYEVTVYNSDLALVKDGRELSFDKGFNKVQFKGVPEMIKPETVIFKDLDYPLTSVLEQNYEYDLVSENKVLEKYLDKDITIRSGVGDTTKEYKGKLLSYLNGIMIDTGSGVVSLKDVKSIEFPELPQGFIAKPTLVWGIETEKGGTHKTQTSYLTTGFNWDADYVAKVNQTDDALDIKGWATIDNVSGADYENAKLKLIAGTVHRVEEDTYPRPTMYKGEMMANATMGMGGGGFSEESFFEYHMYTLGRSTTLKNNQKKQISLFTSDNVPATKVYEYDEEKDFEKVRIVLSLENKKESGLGLPLPEGVIRVYKADSDGQLQFVGEDKIKHTPEDEEIRVFLGNAFDVSVENQTMNVESEGSLLKFGGRCTLTTKQIILKNHKEEDITVKVIARAYGNNVDITKASHTYEKVSTYEYKFAVPVGKRGETTLEYTMRSCW